MKAFVYILCIVLFVSSVFAATSITPLKPSGLDWGCASSSQCLSGYCSPVTLTCVGGDNEWVGVGSDTYNTQSASRLYSGNFILNQSTNITTTESVSLVQGNAYFQPKVVDLNNDGTKEIIIVSGATLNVYRYSGTALTLITSEILNATPTRDGYVGRLVSSEATGLLQYVIGVGNTYVIYGFANNDLYPIKTYISPNSQTTSITCTDDVFAVQYYYCAWGEGLDVVRVWNTDSSTTPSSFNLSSAQNASISMGAELPNERKLYFIDPDNNNNLRIYATNNVRRILYSFFVSTNTTDTSFGTNGRLDFALSYWTSDTAGQITTDAPAAHNNYFYSVVPLYSNPSSGYYLCGNFHHYRTADSKQYGVINCITKNGSSISGYSFDVDASPRNEWPYGFMRVEGMNVSVSGGALNYPVMCSLFPYALNIYATCYAANSINYTFTQVVTQQLLGVDYNRGLAATTLSQAVAAHLNREDNYPSIVYRDSIYKITAVNPQTSNITVYNGQFITNHTSYGTFFADIGIGDALEYVSYKNDSILLGISGFTNVSPGTPYVPIANNPAVTVGGIYGYNTQLCVNGTQNFTARECVATTSNCSYVNTIGMSERLVIESGLVYGAWNNNTPVVSKQYTVAGQYQEHIILQSYDAPSNFSIGTDINFNVTVTNCDQVADYVYQPPTASDPGTPDSGSGGGSNGGVTCDQYFLVLYCLDDVSLSSRVGFAVLFAILSNVLVTAAIMTFNQSPTPMLYAWTTLLVFIACIGGGLLPLYFGGVAILLMVGAVALFALARPKA